MNFTKPLKRLGNRFKNNLKYITLYSLFFILSSSGTYSYFNFLNQTQHSPESEPEVLSAQVVERELPQKPDDLTSLNILLLGFGGPGHQGGYLTDVIQVAHFDFTNNLLTLISIPRDLWVTLPSGKASKINAAFVADANSQPKDNITTSQTTKDMASVITGFPIDYFVAIDFVGFMRTIGYELEGIDVKVEETLTDNWYPVRGLEQEPCGHTPEEIADLTSKYSGFELEKQFPCRYQQVNFEKGIVHMEGGDALAFVRSRHSSSDFSRSARQQAVLEGIKNKVFSLKFVDDAPSFFKSITTHIHTDIDLDIINYLAPALPLIKDFQTVTINLSTDNVLSSSKSSAGAFILVPKPDSNDWKSIHQYINQKIEEN